MLDSSPIPRLKSIDIEALLLAFLLLLIGRLGSFFAQNSILSLISVLSAFSFILLFGAKVSLFLVSRLIFHNSNLLVLSLVPIFGVGFVYLTWMITATFSTFAPIVVLLVTLLSTLLPPKLHVVSSIKRAASSFSQFKKQKLIIALILVQIVLMALTSIALANSSNSIWLSTVFKGLPIWTYASIFAVFGIAIGISLSESKLWPVSVFTLGLWARSFLFAKGFVHFGGDDGENIAVVKYLLNGNIAPFLDLHVSTNYWNWRYGSFETLNFNSNMAFVSYITNLSPEFVAGLMALVASSLLLIVGGYALSRTVLKNDKVSRLSLIFILVLSTAAFWWQLRFDPNLFVSVLFPAYLAATLLLPNSKAGFSVFLFSSFIMFSAHPLAILLVAPCVIYKATVYLRESTQHNFVLYLKKNVTKLLLSVSFIAIMALVLFFGIPNVTFYILRLFSISNLVGLSPGGVLTVGNYVSNSSLLTSYLPVYGISFMFMFFGVVMCLIAWKKIKDSTFNTMNALIIVSCAIAIEILLLDLFVSANPDPVSRLWATVPTIFAPIAASVFSPFLKNKNLKASKKLPSFFKGSLFKVLIILILTIIITVSFVQSAYPTQQSLNFDTLTIQECNLLTTFASSVNLNQSLYLGEYSTMRYISAIRNDWPESGTVVDGDRIGAFIDLAYIGYAESAIKLAAKLNMTNVYVIVLNRYAGQKFPGWWYGGRPYVTNLTSYGTIIAENNAGYILKLNLTE